jgi:hypothetical protein
MCATDWEPSESINSHISIVDAHFQSLEMNSIMRSVVVVLVAMVLVGQAQGKLILSSWFSYAPCQ